MTNLLFKKVDYTLQKLLEDIDMGEIGLPDIQRPFVWGTSKVRDLFDSIYRGYPIGYLLFWENGYPNEHRTIGADKKQKVPRLLIVDGQQRLTSLYAVIKGKPVVDENFRDLRIRIAFNPVEEKFEVTNPAIEKDITWIADISALWQPSQTTYTFTKSYLDELRKKRELTPDCEERVVNAIDRLQKIVNYPLTALEISSSVDEDRVAEIFVRINSKGTPLNQADFILTLMSVFWDEGRKELEDFCRRAKTPPADNRPSPYNHYLRPNPDQLLRVSVALGFGRARLEHVYSLLRGKDLQTRQFSVEQRKRQFQILQQAQAYTLDLQNWHEFLKVLKRAGYRSDQLISSQMAVLYTYALWLIGKRNFKVEPYRLREVMARWFFMAALTSRYTGSPETRMEQDLAPLRAALTSRYTGSPETRMEQDLAPLRAALTSRYTGSPETRMEQDLAFLRGEGTADEFVDVLDRQIDAVLTRDYWEVTLPNELETAAARNTGQFAYYAALCLLDAPVLYSKMKVTDLLAPSTRAKKSALERHHLFPRRYLQSIGIKEGRLINQVANCDLVEWSDNIRISDQAPKEYVPAMEQRFSAEELRSMYDLHALPEKWYEMDYQTFLKERRKRIADVIHRGFLHLKGSDR